MCSLFSWLIKMLYLTLLSTLQHRLDFIDVVKRYIFAIALDLTTWQCYHAIKRCKFLKLLFAHTLICFFITCAKVQEIFELCKLFSLKIVKFSDFSANPSISFFLADRWESES